MSSTEDTFKDIILELQKYLHKYICYCNSPDNLKKINDDVYIFLDEELNNKQTINDFTINCTAGINPSACGIFPQLINIEVSIKIGIDIYGGLLQIRTNTVYGYVRPKKYMAYHSKKENSTDAYERAMRGIG